MCLYSAGNTIFGDKYDDLRPKTNDGHDCGAEVDGKEEGDFSRRVVGSEYGIAIHFEGHKLDISIIEQNTSRKGVKNALAEQGAIRIRVERFSQSNAYSDSNWRSNRIQHRSDPFLPTTKRLYLSNTNSKGDTFEKLMENDSYEQRLEFLCSYT